MYILPPRCKTKQKNLTGLSGLDVSHYTVDAEEIVFTSPKKNAHFPDLGSVFFTISFT